MGNEASEDKAQTPSGMRGIAEGVRNLVAESNVSPESKKEIVAEGEKEPCETCDEAKDAEKEAPKSRFFILDKETGQETPAVFKSEGKEHVPDSVDKLLTWTGMGIHANRRLEDLKGYEEFVKTLIKAKQEGRLIIKDETPSSPSEEERAGGEEPEEDETIMDPAVLKERKRRIALEGELKELKKGFDGLKNFVLQSKTSEMKREIESEMDKFSKTYPLGKKRAKDVWKLLGDVGEDGVPAYTVEQAMKKVHEQSVGDLRDWIKEHPEFIEAGKIKTEGVQEYLKDKEQKEKAPVSSPSGVSTAAVGGVKTEEIKGLKSIGPAIKELLASSKEAGRKA